MAFLTWAEPVRLAEFEENPQAVRVPSAHGHGRQGHLRVICVRAQRALAQPLQHTEALAVAAVARHRARREVCRPKPGLLLRLHVVLHMPRDQQLRARKVLGCL